MTGTSKKEKKEEEKGELKKRLSVDGERKRTSSETSKHETPPKKSRRDSDGHQKVRPERPEGPEKESGENFVFCKNKKRS